MSLQEVWRENQRRRIASLEEEFVNSCQSIGLSHDAALLVERDRVFTLSIRLSKGLRGYILIVVSLVYHDE